MNFKPNDKTTQPTVQADAAASWQDFIIEDLSDEAAAAISGGQWRIIKAPDQPLSVEEVLKSYYNNLAAYIG